MSQGCMPNGYNRATFPDGRKVYFPVITLKGKQRITRKRFRRAQDANDYAKRLAVRVNLFTDYRESVSRDE